MEKNIDGIVQQTMAKHWVESLELCRGEMHAIWNAKVINRIYKIFHNY